MVYLYDVQPFLHVIGVAGPAARIVSLPLVYEKRLVNEQQQKPNSNPHVWTWSESLCYAGSRSCITPCS
jgi:hypothetical protein